MRHSLGEYLTYFSLRALIYLFSLLPVELALFIARILGRLQYVFDFKHRLLAYKNIKIAFAKEKEPQELCRILREGFINFAQNFVELLRLRCLDKNYLEKYIEFVGLKYIDAALAQKRGLILSGIHAGSWEISNASFGVLGYPYTILAETQRKSALLDELLNSYRRSRGYQVISSGGFLRQMIEKLKKNEILGLVIDHGAIEQGVLLKFFGRRAYFPTGELKLALKLDAPLIFGYLYRKKGPYHRLVLAEPMRLEKGGDSAKELVNNLEKLNALVEKAVRAYPEEYLWTYKRWKGSPDKSLVAILADIQNENQRLEEKIKQLKEQEKDTAFEEKRLKIIYKSRWHKLLLDFCAFFSNPGCQGCMRCVKFCVNKDVYRELMHFYADYVVAQKKAKSIAKFIAFENKAELYLV